MTRELHKISEDNKSGMGWLATVHAQELTDKYKPTYSQTQQDEADYLYGLAKYAFPQSKVFLNYRKKFIAVKIANINPDDAASDAAGDFVKFIVQKGYDSSHTSTKSIVRIKRA